MHAIRITVLKLSSQSAPAQNYPRRVDMQTKKKATRRNASRESSTPTRVSRAQRKASENGQVVEKKVADLITSSARKNKSCKLLTSKSQFLLLDDKC